MLIDVSDVSTIPVEVKDKIYEALGLLRWRTSRQLIL